MCSPSYHTWTVESPPRRGVSANSPRFRHARFYEERSCTHCRSDLIGLPPTASSDSVCLRRPKLTTYRCSLPGLTGFAAPRRAGPGHQRYLPRAVPTVPRPRAGIQPRYSGLRVQGTASSPSSTTTGYAITAAHPGVKLYLAADKQGCDRTPMFFPDPRYRQMPERQAQAPRTALPC